VGSGFQVPKPENQKPSQQDKAKTFNVSLLFAVVGWLFVVCSFVCLLVVVAGMPVGHFMEPAT